MLDEAIEPLMSAPEWGRALERLAKQASRQRG
jgi:hypothetical protein